MKKQIFSLILSAAIFTTNPLFAMDPPQPEEEGKGRITHLCPVCELKFPDVANSGSNRLLSNYPDLENTLVLAKLSLKEMLDCSTLSQDMNNLCQKTLVWALFAQKERHFIPKPHLCIKSQFTSYLKLFTEWNDGNTVEPIKYNVSPAQFKDFLETPCETTWWPFNYEKENPDVKSYKFSIENREFELYWSPNNKSANPNLDTRKHDIVFFSGYAKGYKDATSRKVEYIYNVFNTFRENVWIRELKTKK